MFAQTASLFVVLLALGQPPAEKAPTKAPEKAPAAVKVASPEQMQKALRELGDDDFKTREKASDFLRSQGLAAEKTLELALKSEDPEVRERAQAILADFRAGILPGITPAAAKLIRQFRDGDDQQRSHVFQQLAENGEFEAIPQLLKLEKNEDLRRLTLRTLVQNAIAIEKLVAADKLSLLLDLIEADENEEWRTSITLELLISGKVLGKGTNKKQLALLEKILADDSQTKVHQRLSEELFLRNPETIAGLLENKHLHFVLKVLARDNRPQFRQMALRRIASREKALDFLFEDQGLKDLLAFSQVKLKGVDCSQIVSEVLTSDSVAAGLLKKRGVDGLLKLPTEMQLAPAERARFLGQLLSTSQIQQELQNTGKQNLIVTLVEDEKDLQLRREYFKGLLASGDRNNRQLGYFQQQLPQLWKIFKQDYQDPPTAESAWQAGAVLELLPYLAQTNPEFIRSPEEARWFLQLIRGLKPEIQGLSLQNLLRQYTVLKGFLKQGQYDDLLKLIKSLPKTAERGSALAILGQSPDLVAYLVAEKRLPELLQIGQEEAHAFCRGAYYETLFANAAAMDELLKNGSYPELLKLAQLTEKDEMSAKLFGSLVQTKGFIRHLKEQRQLDLITSFATAASPAVRRLFFTKLFVSLPAMTELMETDNPQKWLDLLAEKEVKNDPFGPAAVSLTRVFYLSPPVIARLAQRQELDKVLTLAAKSDDDRNSNQFLSQLLQEPKNVVVFLEQGKFKEIVKLIGLEKQEYARSSAYRALLTSQETIPILIRTKQVDDLLEILTKESTNKDYNILDGLMDHQGRFVPLVKQGYFGKLLELILNGSPEVISRRLNYFLNHTEVAQHLSAEKEQNVLLQVVKAQTKAEVRQALMTGIFSSHHLMNRLIQSQRYESLLGLVQAEPDSLIRGKLLVAFAQNENVLQRLKQTNQLAQLVEFARKEADDSLRSSYLNILLRNQQAMQSLLQEKQFDPLLAQIERDQDADRRAKTLVAFYSNMFVVPELVSRKQLDKLLEMARKLPDEAQRYNLLFQLCNDANFVKAMVDQEKLTELVALVQQQNLPLQRGRTLGALYANRIVLAKFAVQDRGQELYRVIAKESPESRQEVLQGILTRGEVIDLLIEADQFEELFQLTKEVKNVQIRGNILGQLISSQLRLPKQNRTKRIGMLVDAVLELTDSRARMPYLWNIVQNESVVLEFIAAGKLDSLQKLVAGDSDSSGQQQMLWRTLFGSEKMLETLSQAEKLVPLLEQLAKLEEPRRSANLQPMLANSGTVSWLIAHGHFTTFAELCQSSTDANLRCLGLASLLQSPPAIRLLAKEGKLTGLLAQLLNEPQEGARRQALQTWTNFSSTLEALIQNDQFQPLWDYATKDADPALSLTWQVELLLSPPSFQKFKPAEHGQLLLANFSKQAPLDQQAVGLIRMLNSPAAMDMLVSEGKLDTVIGLVKQQPMDRNRAFQISSLMVNPAAMKELSEKARVSELLELIRTAADSNIRWDFLQRMINGMEAPKWFQQAEFSQLMLEILQHEPNQQNRLYAARFMLNQANVRQPIIESGQGDLLKKIAQTAPEDKALQEAFGQALFAPSGLVSFHLRKKEFPQAIALAEAHAQEDVGMLRLASCLALTGGLEKKIAEIKAGLVEKPSEPNSRLLAWLLRAKGDLAGASEVAARDLTPGFQKMMLVEAGDWKNATRLQLAESNRLPLALPVTIEDIARFRIQNATVRIEHLAFLAAYSRLANQPEVLAKTLQEIQQMAADFPQESPICWQAMEALFLNSQVTEAEGILTAHYQDRAFGVLIDQNRFQQAFSLVNWPKDSIPTREWLEGLPLDLDLRGRPFYQRVNLAMRVADARQRLGHRADADKIIALVEAGIENQPNLVGGRQSQMEGYHALGLWLLRMQREEQVCRVATLAAYQPTALPEFLRQADPSRAYELGTWWSYLRQSAPETLPVEHIAQVRRILYPRPEDTKEDFLKLVGAARQVSKTLPIQAQEAFLAGIAVTCLKRGEIDLAQQLLPPLPRSAPYLAIAQEKLADAFWAKQQWADAARYYTAVWTDNHDKVAQLYLAGEALVRAEKTEAGAKLKEQALLSALEPQFRLSLAGELLDHDLRAPAVELYTQVSQWALPEQWQWYEASRRIHDLRTNAKLSVLVDGLERSLLDKLKVYFVYNSFQDYLKIPATIHRLKAKLAVQDKDFEAAKQEIATALRGMPAETLLAEELVPLLEAQGQQSQADAVYGAIASGYSAALKDYPEASVVHNQWAWLSARCGRDLPQAQGHAEKAVALEPNYPAYIDTLAEVKFRLGERAAAVKLSEKALELSGGSLELKKQLERFQNDPIPPLAEKK